MQIIFFPSNIELTFIYLSLMTSHENSLLFVGEVNELNRKKTVIGLKDNDWARMLFAHEVLFLYVW